MSMAMNTFAALTPAQMATLATLLTSANAIFGTLPVSFHFTQTNDISKHLESHLKTNVCRNPQCHNQSFSSKAVLPRHEKETHGLHAAEQYRCPVLTCERNKRPFPREYNMADHIQRVHKTIDAATYLKKGRRSRKVSHSGPSGGVGNKFKMEEDGACTPVAGRGVRKQRGVRRRDAEKMYNEQLSQVVAVFESLKGGMEMVSNRRLISKVIDQLNGLEEFCDQVIRLEND
jgi:hypothetical protein